MPERESHTVSRATFGRLYTYFLFKCVITRGFKKYKYINIVMQTHYYDIRFRANELSRSSLGRHPFDILLIDVRTLSC
jgi:hypothetical protein